MNHPESPDSLKMIISPKSNDTMRECHIKGQPCLWHNCSFLSLTHSISLPEQGDLLREALEYYTLRPINTSAGRVDEKRIEKSRGFESSPTLCVSSELSPSKRSKTESHRGTHRRQNLFIPETEMNEDDEEEEDDENGDNLHRYHEGSSLQLQGNVTPNFSQAREKKDQVYEDCMVSKRTPVLMDCDELEWADSAKHTSEEVDNYWASTENLLKSITQNQTEYTTDSSCTSSDGILVNFSAIYNKSSNAVPATPIHLDSPHLSSPELQDRSNSLLSWTSHSADPNCNNYPIYSEGFTSVESSDLVMCQAQVASSTKKYYKLVTCDISSQSSPSPPWSSLTSSLGSCSPPTEYFLFGHSEGERKKYDKSEQVNGEMEKDSRISEDQGTGHKEKTEYGDHYQSASRQECSHHSAKTSKSRSLMGSQKSTSNLGKEKHSWAGHLNTNLSSPSSENHDTSFTQKRIGIGDLAVQTSSYSNHTQGDPKPGANPNTDKSIQSNAEGAHQSFQEVLRYTKAQRPNFLPIQPFVLQTSTGNQQNKTLGSLLDQYINNKPGPSKATCKNKGTSKQYSPYRSSSNLEAITTSDTCSTCTSSPIQTLLSPKPCSRANTSLMSLLESVPLVQTQATLESREATKDPLNALDTSCKNSSPANTSLISITSLISTEQNSVLAFEDISEDCTNMFHVSELERSSCVQKKQHSEHSFTRTTTVPEEYHLSPDQQSINHHKKNMLKAVSLAVDLITANFNSGTDPNGQIPLRNRLPPPTMSNLVLKQLYPAVLNILQHGLKAYKLDLIVGQRRNKLWSVVEATTQQDPSNQLPESIVSLVKRCSKLSNCIRLRIFFTELLNSHTLDFWISNLHSCVDVLKEYYHQWGFLVAVLQPTEEPLFQELLFLLQPLSLLPFNLHLPSEPNLESNESLTHSGPQICHPSDLKAKIFQKCSIEDSRSPGHNIIGKIFTGQIKMNQTVCAIWKKEDLGKNEKCPMQDKDLSMMQWARLFGSGAGTQAGFHKTITNINRPLRSRRPSDWLKLGASKVELLAQSVWTSGQRN